MSDQISWKEMLDGPTAGQHIGQLYRNKEQLAKTVSHYITQGLQRGEAVLVMATAAHWTAFVAQLATSPKVDLVGAVMKGQLRIIDAELNLSVFMADGMPQWEGFRESVGSIIERSRKQFGVVRIYGEMADVLWQKGNRQAATCLEEFWSELMRAQAFSLLCAYRADDADPAAYDAAFECVCNTHTHLVPSLDEGRKRAGASASVKIDSPSSPNRQEMV